MAKLNGPLSFSGNLSGISVYQRRDIEKPILRTRTGPSKGRIDTDPAFALTKKNYTEWGGCSKGAKWVRLALRSLEPTRDHNWAAQLSGLLKRVQQMDSEGLYGQRALRLSHCPHYLEGFPLSRRTSFESVVRAPLTLQISKEQLSAALSLPPLLPGVNFFPATHLPYFQVRAVLGIVPDLFYTPHGYRPSGVFRPCHPQVFHSSWLGIKGGCGEMEVSLALPAAPETSAFTLLLAVGISFGTVSARGCLEAVAYNGCGKVVAAI